MNEEKVETLYRMIGDIDEQLVEDAATVVPKKGNIFPFEPGFNARKVGVLVASLTMVAFGVWGVGGLLGSFEYSDSAQTSVGAPDMDVSWESEELSEDTVLLAVAESEEAAAAGNEETGGGLKIGEEFVTDVHVVFEEEQVVSVALEINEGVNRVEIMLVDGDEELWRLQGAVEIGGVFVITSGDGGAQFILDGLHYYVEIFDEDLIYQLIVSGGFDLSMFE